MKNLRFAVLIVGSLLIHQLEAEASSGPCPVTTDLPLVTHYISGTGAAYGGTDLPAIYNPSLAADFDDYKAGLRPFVSIYRQPASPGQYIGDTYAVQTYTNEQVLAALEQLCQSSGLPIRFKQFREPLTAPEQLLRAINFRSASWQILHAIPFRHNLFTLVLPPNLQPGELLPFLANGFYDLNSNFVDGEGRSLRKVLGLNLAAGHRAAGILWNGQGAVASRTMNESAYVDFNDFLQIVFSALPFHPRKGIAFGISRGGVTALNLASHPRLTEARFAYVDAGVPASDPRLIGHLTSPTVPALLDASDWSVGFLSSWMNSFRYPNQFSPSLAGLTGSEAHVKILTNLANESDYDNLINLRSSNRTNRFNQNRTAVFLEVSSNDFIVPFVDQVATGYEYFRNLNHITIKVNFLGGHNFEADRRDQRLLTALMRLDQTEDLTSPTPTKELNLFMMDPQTRLGVPFSLAYTALPVAIDIPRFLTHETPVQVLVTGLAGRSLTLNFRGSNGDIVQKPITINDSGYAIIESSINNWPSAEYTLEEVLDTSEADTTYRLLTRTTHKLDDKLKMTRVEGDLRIYANAPTLAVNQGTYGPNCAQCYIQYQGGNPGEFLSAHSYGLIEVGREVDPTSNQPNWAGARMHVHSF